MRILIIEANQVVCCVWYLMGKSMGHEISLVSDVWAARKLIKGDAHLDAIIVGHYLDNGQTGFELVRLAKSLPHRSKTFVAFVTNAVGLDNWDLQAYVEQLGARYWRRDVEVEGKIREIKSMING